MRKETRLLIGNFLLSFLIIGIIAATMVAQRPPLSILETNYKKVISMKRELLSTRCLGGRRHTYEFVAIRQDGVKVDGYFCYNPSLFSLGKPTIHEN